MGASRAANRNMGTLAQKLSQVPGVGLVTVGGSQNPSIRIQLNPAQLAAMNLDFETVRLALANLTVVQPTGLLYGGQQAVALQTNDQLMTAQGFDDAIVAYRSGRPIRIRDMEVDGSPAKHGISIAGQPLSQIRREVNDSDA
jgi:multidrug efflux pump subunit AcrB